MYYSEVKCSAAAALCGVVLICLIIYSHNLFIISSPCATTRENQATRDLQCVIMCGSHEIWSTAIMQISAGVSLVAGNEFPL